MLFKVVIGGALLLLTGSCIAGSAAEIAEEQVRALSHSLPIMWGEDIKIVGVRLSGSKITYELEPTVAKEKPSKNDSAALAQTIRDIQCADPSTRNYLAQGISYEMKFLWKYGVTSSFDINPKICGVKKGEVSVESEASVRHMVDSLSPNLPRKVDEITTWISVSQVGKMGLKYTYTVDTNKRNVNATQLENSMLFVKNKACNDLNLSTLMRGGVKIFYSYQTISGKPLAETTVTIASCKG